MCSTLHFCVVSGSDNISASLTHQRRGRTREMRNLWYVWLKITELLLPVFHHTYPQHHTCYLAWIYAEGSHFWQIYTSKLALHSKSEIYTRVRLEASWNLVSQDEPWVWSGAELLICKLVNILLKKNVTLVQTWTGRTWPWVERNQILALKLFSCFHSNSSKVINPKFTN